MRSLARSPALSPIAAVYLYGLLAGLVILAAVRMPSPGVTFRPVSRSVEVMAAGARIAVLPPDAEVVFTAGGQRLRQPAGELVADYSPRGTRAQVADWFAGHTRLTALVARPGATMTLPDHAPIALHPRDRRFTDLPLDSWLLLAQGALLTLLGSWLLSIRARDWGARMFALSCAGIAVTSLAGALYDARALTADGALLHACQTVNFAGTYLGSAALTAIFALQPHRLMPPTPVLVAIALATAWGAAAGVGWLPLTAFYLGLLAVLLAFPLVFALQAYRCRADPAAQAALRWVGVTTLLGAGQVAVAMSLPKLLDLPDLGGDGSTILPLAIVYGGIAFGIGKHRLFELDRWTYRVVLGAAAVLGLLILDAALVALFDVERPLALGLALATVGFLYLPLRTLVWRRIMGVDRLADGETFQLATAVAFAPSAAARREGWRMLLQRLFEPLAILPAEPVAEVALLDGGGALALPAVADEGPLRLSFRARGTRLFGRDQLRLAAEMVALMRRADATRAEYARGVGEERQRIARDLHDDVCAMLLTSLHREDVGKVRGDVRNAMADIRTMIGELTGERVTLDRALADLRFETSERLAAAGLQLAWPLPDVAPPPAVLDYAHYRALLSVLREAVSNTLKHAGATRVAVTVSVAPDRLTIRVVDDGVGVPEPIPDGGRGIANMSARMLGVGGSFAIAVDGGTAVTLSMPLVQADRPHEPGMGQAARVG